MTLRLLSFYNSFNVLKLLGSYSLYSCGYFLPSYKETTRVTQDTLDRQWWSSKMLSLPFPIYSHCNIQQKSLHPPVSWLHSRLFLLSTTECRKEIKCWCREMRTPNLTFEAHINRWKSFNWFLKLKVAPWIYCSWRISRCLLSITFLFMLPRFQYQRNANQ